MTKRYVYAYTEAQLSRRRWLVPLVCFPVWIILVIAIGSPIVGRSNGTFLLISAVVVGLLLSAGQSWLIKRQIDTVLERYEPKE